MNLPDSQTAPLADLYTAASGSDALGEFARVLDTRLNDGRADEVRAFLCDCEERCLNRMQHLSGRDAPWLRDGDGWLAFARLTVPRGHLFNPPRDMPRSAALAAEMRTLAEHWLANARAAGLPGHKGIGLVIGRMLPWLCHPGMSREQLVALLDWTLALRDEAGFNAQNAYRTAWGPIIAALDEADLVRYAAQGSPLFDDIIQHYERVRAKGRPSAEAWAPWRAFFAQHLPLFEQTTIDDPDLIAQAWALTDPAQRQHLAERLTLYISAAEGDELAHAEAIFDRLAHDDIGPFAEHLRERGYSYVSPPLARHLLAAAHTELWPLLLQAIAQNCEYEEDAANYQDIARVLVARRPDDLAEVPVKHLTNLLPVLDRDSLHAALPVLARIITGSSAKGLRASLARVARLIEPARLVAAGWLNKPPKNLLLACRDVLLAHPDAAAAPLLAQLLADGKLDAASASLVEQRLRQLAPPACDPAGAATAEGGAGADAGGDTPDTSVDLAALEVQVATVKRLAAAIKPFDTPDVLALCTPLSEHAARVLLHLAATAEGGLPPLAAQLLAPLSVEHRARLALALVEHWIAADGDPKQRWALKLLPGHADDRVVDVLVAAVQAWNKPRLQRAAAAVEQLGEVDTLYALLRVQEIAESRKLKDMVVRAGRVALRAAAARRHMSVAELFDELTPDFGLGGEQGLTLTVGVQSYRVELQGDLSLRVINDKGKAGKSIPAVKDESLKAEWETASARLKTLAASLKTVVKQQGPRMLAALVSGKRWPQARWQRLFVEHPLLRIVGRSLIWRAEDAPALVRSSFRLAEDFTLVDVEDEPVALPEGCSISLWHPATAAPGEREAWQAYFADYELDALVDQLGACAELPAATQFKDGTLLPPAPLTLAQEQLSGLLKKFGYRPGPVGDGPSIDEHVWRLPALELSIELAHGYYPPYLELGLPVAPECFRVRDLSKEYWASLDAAALPKPLLATLQGQWRAMAAKGNQADGGADQAAPAA